MSKKAPPSTEAYYCDRCNDGKPYTLLGIQRHDTTYCPAIASEYHQEAMDCLRLPKVRREENQAPMIDGDEPVYDQQAGYADDTFVDTNINQTAVLNEAKRKRTKPQDRAVTYSSTLMWNRPSVQLQADARTREAKQSSHEARVAASSFLSLDGHDQESSDEEHLDESQDVAFGPPPEENESESEDDEDDKSSSSDDDSMDDKSISDDEADLDRDDFPDHDEQLEQAKKKYRDVWHNYAHNVIKNIPHDPHPKETGTKKDPNLPMLYVAQVSLLNILAKHRGSDLNLFNEIMKWVLMYSDEHPKVWTEQYSYPIRTRQGLLPFLEETFDASTLLPSPKEVTMANGKDKATVPCFDVEAMLLNILTNKELMSDENFLKDHFDCDTLRPTKSYDDLDDDDTIHDVHCGTLYHEGIKEFCPDDVPLPDGIKMIVPIPLVMYSDESHHDNNGGNKTTPVSMAPAFFNSRCRAKYEYWFNAAFIPSMDIGKGKFKNTYDEEWTQAGRKKGKKNKTPENVRIERVTNYHVLYRAALSSLRELCLEKGGVVFNFKGKRCLGKPFLLFALGDAKEYNIMCQHYNSAFAKCIMKDCTCTKNDIVNRMPPECRPISVADIHRSLHDEEYANSISQHPVKSAWNELPLSNLDEGINGMTPYEPLHVHGMGTYSDGADAIHDLISPKVTTKKAEKEEIDLLFHHVAYDIGRNSERDRPRFSTRTGAMDRTRLTANERMGNYLLLAVCLSTARGREIMSKAIKNSKGTTSVPKLIYSMSLMLAYDQWTKCPRTTKGELRRAKPAVAHLMQRAHDDIPRPVVQRTKGSNIQGSHGYHKLKFHAIYKFLDNMKKLGSARGWNGEHGEKFHIESVKKNGDRTQRRKASFTYQVGTNDGRSNVGRLAYEKVRHRDPLAQDARSNAARGVSAEERRLYYTGEVTDEFCDNVSGRYELVIDAKPKGQSRNRSFGHSWNSREKNVVQTGLNTDLLYCLSIAADNVGWGDRVHLDGYTELKVESDGGNTVYRASESFYGGQWYDWALMEDPKKPGVHVIGKILGFVRWRTPGYATYALQELEDMSVEKILEEKSRDNATYVIFEASEKIVGTKPGDIVLDKTLITRFNLWNEGKHFVYPTTCIKKPLMIVRDFGTKHSRSYLHVLPQREWSNLFRAKIHELEETE